MNKIICRVIGVIMFLIAIVFVIFVLNNPQISVNIDNRIIYIGYGIYTFIMLSLLFSSFIKSDRHNEEKVLLLNKTKHGFLNALFGRMGIITILFLAQIIVILMLFNSFQEYSDWIWMFMSFLSAVIVINIINKTDQLELNMLWILLIMLVPFIGVPLYVYIKNDIGYGKVNKKINKILSETRYLKQDENVSFEIKSRDKQIHNVAKYTMKYFNYPVYKNSSIKYFALGEEKFEEMIKQLKKAEKYIFLEYFIIEEGYMWGKILAILAEKAKQGVDIRIIYDGTCSFYTLPSNYPKKLAKLGIKCKIFAPLTPFVSTHYNNRDHRKILIIDGKTVFTGGINLADEYINKKVVNGHWKDTAIMIKGEAIDTFILMFLQMWNIYEKADFNKYLHQTEKIKSDGYILPYGDTPTDKHRLGQKIYLNILNTAVEYVHIMSPYLILDNETISALKFAAERGVDVKILLPHIPDKKIVYAIARTYYMDLIKSGVEIYEYTEGFVHAKIFVSDNIQAVVGTINLDYRSLYHHFECATYIYNNTNIYDIENDFQRTLQKSHIVTTENLKKDNIFFKIYGIIARIFAPLM